MGSGSPQARWLLCFQITFQTFRGRTVFGAWWLGARRSRGSSVRPAREAANASCPALAGPSLAAIAAVTAGFGVLRARGQGPGSRRPCLRGSWEVTLRTRGAHPCVSSFRWRSGVSSGCQESTTLSAGKAMPRGFPINHFIRKIAWTLCPFSGCDTHVASPRAGSTVETCARLLASVCVCVVHLSVSFFVGLGRHRVLNRG